MLSESRITFKVYKWEIFLSKKPTEGQNHPDDEKLLAEAKATIGDYKLKESPDYKVDRELRETTVKKYKQVMDIRLKQYNLRHEYIQSIWDIRDQKYTIRQHLVDKRDELLKIHEEIPEDLCNIGPDIPDVDQAEFPEEKLRPNIILPKAILIESDTELKQPFVKPPSPDQEESELLPKRSTFPNYADHKFESLIDNDVIEGVCNLDFKSLLSFSENTDTPLEMDIRVNRLNRKLFEQTNAVYLMEKEITEFNNILNEAKRKRLPLLVGGNFIDVFILTLNRELNILKRCEDNEDALSEKVNENLRTVHKMEDLLDILKNDKEHHEFNIENCHIEEGKIQDHFKHVTENNKFYDFLKKVFKKKYKPPKQPKGDDEESSSSSSSSSSSDEMDDTASLDSRDFAITRQDLSVCPKGCEAAIFKLTIDLRTKRHEIEQVEINEYKMLETVKKAIELNKKKNNALQNQLQLAHKALEDFQREKQKQLNQVMCTIVLHLDQMYGFNPDVTDISDLLVFSKTALTNLYKRVAVLQHEDFAQKGKLNTYHRHVMRLKKDINYMNKRIKELKRALVELMQIKFGKVVDINEIDEALIKRSFQKSQVNELEEVFMKKLVFDLRIETTDIKSLFAKELSYWIAKISKRQTQLSEIIMENTKKIELLRVLSSEKQKLLDIIRMQPKKKELIEIKQQAHQEFLGDTCKLESILEEQTRQLQALKSEIKMLRTKGLPPQPPIAEDYQGDGWTGYHEYIDAQMDVEKPMEEMQPIYLSESQDIVTDLLKKLLERFDSELTRRSTENMVRNILSGIMRCTSVQDIIHEILNNIPYEPTDEQHGMIELTAEKLFLIQEPELSEESFTKCARELLEETIDEVMLMEGHPHEVMTRMIERLVQSIPFNLLMEEQSIDMIIAKVTGSMQKLKLDKEALIKSIENVPSFYKNEMMMILNMILERVYSTGIDYLYVIHQ